MALLKNLINKGALGLYDPRIDNKPSKDVVYATPMRAAAQGESLLNRALYQFYGNNMPVAMADDLTEYIQNGYCRNSDLYAIIKYILRCAIKIDYNVMIETRSGKLEIATESDAYGYLQQYLSNDVEEELIGHQCLTGNTYMYTPSNASGKPVGAIEVLPSNYTKILFNEYRDPIRGYKLEIGDSTTEFPVEEITHWRNWNPDFESGKGFYGMSPVRAAAMLVTESNEASISNVKRYHNGGPEGIIAADGPEGFFDQEAKQLESKIKGRHSGSWKRGGVITTPAQIKWIQTGLSPADLKILEQMKFSFERMCRVFGFPVTIMDSKASTLDNMATSEVLLYSNCILPLCDGVLEMLQTGIVNKFDKRLKVRLGTSRIESLQSNKKELAEWLDKCDYINVNRKQELMGEEADPAMNGYLIRSGYEFFPAGQSPEAFAINEEKHLKIIDKEYGRY